MQAAKIVEQDVAGVGLNCGCPKSFSIQGGMGAALLSEPEKLCSVSLESSGFSVSVWRLPRPVCDSPTVADVLKTTLQILSALSSSLTVPVDAKIRLLPEQAPTLELVEKVIVTGISALTVHCRTKVSFRAPCGVPWTGAGSRVGFDVRWLGPTLPDPPTNPLASPLPTHRTCAPPRRPSSNDCARWLI